MISIWPRRALVAAGLCGMLTLSQRDATAQTADEDHPRLRWKDEWPRFTGWQYASTLVLFTTSLGFSFLVEPPQEPRWAGTLPLDQEVREGLALSSRTGRDNAAAVSDVLFYGLWVYPLIVDNIAVTWLGEGATDVASEMFWINLEAFSISGIGSAVPESLVGRARPYAESCKTDPNYDAECGTRAANQSFISGHTNTAFTAASLICLHHQQLELYGDPIADALTCGLSVAGATAVGVLRMNADRHYLSDTLPAATWGFLSGYALPWLLHYRARDESDASTVPWRFEQGAVMPVVSHDAFGLALWWRP